MVFGEVTPETLTKSRYGSGMMVSMRRGTGRYSLPPAANG